MSEAQNYGDNVPSSTREGIERARQSARYVGVMINVISAIAGIISLIVVCSVVFIAVTGGIIPEVLSNWGGIILGFYFGQFINMVNSYIGILEKK